MRIVPLSEAKTRIGEPITCVTGMLSRLYDFKSGISPKTKKPWALQNGEITDGDTAMKVCFNGREEVPAKWKGGLITVTASDKKGITGIYCEENKWEKDGKEHCDIILRITPSATIDFGTTPGTEKHEEEKGEPLKPPFSNTAGKPPAQDEETQALAALAAARKVKAERLAAEAKAKAAEASAESSGKTTTGADFGMARRRILQMANLYRLSLRSAKWALASENLSLADIPGAAATIYIGAKDDGLIEAMPHKPLELDLLPEVKKLEAPPPDLHEREQEWTGDPTSQPNPTENIDQDTPATWQEIVCHVEPFIDTALGTIHPNGLQALFSTFQPKPAPGTTKLAMRDTILMNGLVAWKKSTKS